MSESGEINQGVQLAIQKAGSQRALGKLLDRSQPAVQGYLHGKPPPLIALKIEEVTGVSRKLIRPDVFGKN